MKAHRVLLSFLVICLLISCSGGSHLTISIPDNPDKLNILAAKEIRKYIYLRSDLLATITRQSSAAKAGNKIVLLVDTLLNTQEFRLKTIVSFKGKTLIISGGSSVAVLYGAYEFAEQLGVRFYLYGDVVPDKKIRFSIPDLDISKDPLFQLRGILPFHDFPEGPDWWNEGDYKAVISQLPKMKMNFIGFHTYPWRYGFNGEGPKSEPLVWIGKEEDINNDGSVRSSYPVLHFHTADSTWGYRPAKTSEFLSGASQLFETDNFGPDYMKDMSPWPHTNEENTRIFNDYGRLISEAFGLAKLLGVKTCVGTETPLIIPEPLKKLYNIKAVDENIIKDLYKGIFRRIQKTYPLDYYWLWTPEGWTWGGVEDRVVAETKRDMEIAYAALRETGSLFSLATCGWVLGPPKDRTEFDKSLPDDMPFSCINRGLGYTPVDKGFNAISGRSKWSIPWMEDDPALLTAQLWAGRMRKDAFDSWKYGCDGLFGIHWRTRNISPTVSALAKAAWECNTYDGVSERRDLPVDDFYSDFVKSEFGIDEPAIVKIFTDLDGKGVELKEGYKGDAPLNASDWIHGPGALMTNKSESDLKERIVRYDFLPVFESFGKKISGKGSIERYNYWLNLFRFNKAVLETTLAQIRLKAAIDSMMKNTNETIRKEIAENYALKIRIELAEKWKEMNSRLLAFVSTNGELGTIANLEMHNIRMNGNFTGYDGYLKSVLNLDLPQSAYIDKKYHGETRIVVTTNQSILQRGEDFYIRTRILSETNEISGKLYFKELGEHKYRTCDLKQLGSNVFEVKLSPEQIKGDFEYFIEIKAGDKTVLYPSTAKEINNSVIVL